MSKEGKVLTHFILLSSLLSPSVVCVAQLTAGIDHTLALLVHAPPTHHVEFTQLLQQFDRLTPVQQSAAAESLLPPNNFGLVAGSFYAMDQAFNSTTGRIEDIHGFLNRYWRTQGENLGDPIATGSGWIKIIGGHLNQRAHAQISGFTGNPVGIALGTDWGLSDCTTLGLAASYTKDTINDSAANPKNIDIKSYQGTGYGWFDLTHQVYLNAMLGFAKNRYHLHRFVQIDPIHTSTRAYIDASQVGARAELGWVALENVRFYCAPILRMQYLFLKIKNYNEDAAELINLSVSTRPLHEGMGGMGARLGTLIETDFALLVPELTALLGYDFYANQEQTTANFIGEGVPFVTTGGRFGRTLFELGLGLDLHVGLGSIFSLKYDLQWRDRFIANSGFFQYNIIWS